MVIISQLVVCASRDTTSGSSATAPTSSMWKSSFPKGKDPRDKGGKK